jgi:hypothetical protein
MGGYAEVEYSAPVMSQHQKYVEHLEAHIQLFASTSHAATTILDVRDGIIVGRMND